MKTVKPILYIVVAALALYGIYAIFTKPKELVVPAPVTVTPTPPTPVATETLIDKSLVKTKTYTTPDKYTTFKVEYPQFTNASAEFNTEIADAVTDGIKSQNSDAEANWKARYETSTKAMPVSQFPKDADKFSFIVSWTSTQVNRNYISILLNISGYSGGAHGYENILSFNYDVAKKSDVKLVDLFPNDPDYLKTIATYARKDLETQFRKRLNIKTKEEESNFQENNIEMLDAGSAPTAENYTVFTFTPKLINIIFTQYQVAPYAMGDSTVAFPRS